MESRSKRFISTLLALTMIVGLFAAMPLTAAAQDAAALAETINNFAHGGSGALSASVNGDVVTVTGTVTGATNELTLRIDADVTVVWKAEYSGAQQYFAISLGGDGVFEVADGGSVVNSNGHAITYAGIFNLKVNGGTVRSVGSSGSRHAVNTGTGGANIEVLGGVVESVNANAISAQRAKIHVSGGTVSSGNSTAIDNKGDGAITTVSGGVVRSEGRNPAITSALDGSSVTISDGLVESVGDAFAISVYYFYMTGGEVRNTGERATLNISKKLDVSGGVVSNVGGCAITVSGASADMSVNGGFVFSDGNYIVRKTGELIRGGFVIHSGSSEYPISGNAVVCAWDKAAGNTTYNEGTSTDLIAEPDGASVKWGISDGEGGIVYANGANTGFFPLSGVTIVPAGGGAPVETPPEIPVEPTPSPTPTQTPGADAWGEASDWAQTELAKADELGLIPDALRGQNMTKPITRAEFAAVSVKTYEALSGTAAIPAVVNPFKDTNDVEVLKAYNVGITAGTAADEFSPDVLLNREQCATMLTRVFKKVSMPGWTLATDADFPLAYTRQAPFADDAQISDYARDSVYFMVSHKIIFGTDGNMFSPRATTADEEARGYAQATREQALAIAVRMVNNLR